MLRGKKAGKCESLICTKPLHDEFLYQRKKTAIPIEGGLTGLLPSLVTAGGHWVDPGGCLSALTLTFCLSPQVWLALLDSALGISMRYVALGFWFNRRRIKREADSCCILLCIEQNLLTSTCQETAASFPVSFLKIIADLYLPVLGHLSQDLKITFGALGDSYSMNYKTIFFFFNENKAFFLCLSVSQN